MIDSRRLCRVQLVRSKTLTLMLDGEVFIGKEFDNEEEAHSEGYSTHTAED